MASQTYAIVEVFTSEGAHWHGSPLYEAIVHLVARDERGGRCIVTKGVAGCFENGRVASHRVLDISYNMPVKVEIIVPQSELEKLLPHIEEMVGDGIVLVREADVRLHRTAVDQGSLPRA